MTDYTYSRVAALNFTTVPTTVGRSATGSVYAIGDTTYTTPLNVTMVIGGIVTTTISSDANGFFPDFTVANRTSVVFKQTGTSFTSVLTTTDPVPGPQGTPGNSGAQGVKGDRGDLASWQATTFYPLNQLISNPVGDLVKVTTAHTSTGSYDATKFDYVVPPSLTPAALNATILDQIETPIADAVAPKQGITDAQTIARLDATGASDRLRSASQARINFEDAATFTESWANLSAWTTPGTPGVQVSGGKLYSTGLAGGGSGANHSFAIGAGKRMRAQFIVDLSAGMPGTAGGIIVGVNGDAAGAVPTAGAGTARGIYFNNTAVQAWKSGVATTLTWGSSNLTYAAEKHVVTVIADENWITVTARGVGTGREFRQRWARTDGYVINNLYVFNSDPRGLTGYTVDKVGARAEITTVTPQAGIEDVTNSVLWSGNAFSNYRHRVLYPVSYDPRKTYPVLMMFHGSGSDETIPAWYPTDKGVADAFSAAGYIVLSSAAVANTSSWGAQNGLDAHYSGYRYLRDTAQANIGPIVFYGNSMGGLESLLSLAERRIPGVVASLLTVPVTNLAINHANAAFTTLIRTAYGIAGDGSDYAAKTADHDPVLMEGWRFRGLPTWVLVATDDAVIDPAANWNLLEPIIQPFLPVYTRVNVTGGHTTSSITSNAGAMVTFANKYVTA